MKNKSSKHSDFVLFKCSKCNSEENIPKNVVDFFDVMDEGDSSVPPKFSCQKCSAEMLPVHYVNHQGFAYSS